MEIVFKGSLKTPTSIGAPRLIILSIGTYSATKAPNA